MSEPISNYDGVHAGFSVSDAAGVAFAIFFRRFLQVFLISLLSLAPLAGMAFFVAATEETPEGVALVLVTALTVLSASLCEGMMFYAVFQHLRGSPVTVLASLRRGCERFIPVVLTSLLATLLIVVGLVLLFIPGVVIGAILAMAIPVCVVERLNPIECLKRSSWLTSGYRWGIFGISAAIGLCEQFGDYLMKAAFLSSFDRSLYGWATAFVLLYTLAEGYRAVLLAVIYHGLRKQKEGVDLDQIAAAFE